LDKLNASYFKGVNATSNFGPQLLKNVTNNLASDLMNSALTGRPFDEASLQKSLVGALTTTGMAQGAFAIGEGLKNGDLDAFTHKLAHAVLGCAGGAAIAGNSSGCAPGAVGAVVGEMAAQFYNPSGDPTKTTDTVNFAKIMAGVAGVVIGGGGDNVQAVNIASTAGANAAENNRQLHPDERKLAARLAAKSKGLYTAKQIEDAMRNSGNGKRGENVNYGSIIDINDEKARYDKGAQWTVSQDGKSLVQVMPNNLAVDPALAAFITSNTGASNSTYSWYDYQLGKTSPLQANTGTGTTKQRYEQYAANGKVYTLPIADCPAVSCTNDTPIARYGVSAEDAATIAAYDAAKKDEMVKTAVKGAVIVGTAATLPVTLPGVLAGGAIYGASSSTVDQYIDKGEVDAGEVVKDAAVDAAAAGLTLGVIKGSGILLTKGAEAIDGIAANVAAKTEGAVGTNGGTNLLDGATASGDTVYHGNVSTAIGDDLATVNNFKNAINTGNGHNVIVHGQLTYDELGGIPIVNGRVTNPAQIAEAVKSNPSYIEGSQVCFASCWSGSSGSAQELANSLKAPIFAPSRPVAWNAATNKWIFDTDVPGMQIKNPQIIPEWKMFYPASN
jgi:hypothetical protein